MASYEQDEKNLTRFTIGTYNYERWIKPNPKPQLEVYEDRGKWHWRLRTKTGILIAQSVYGFDSKKECASAQSLCAVEMREAVVVEVGDESTEQEP